MGIIALIAIVWVIQVRVNLWARAGLNRRSSPCQGDVIAPRPRALGLELTGYPIILEILPVQPS